jgi:DNA-3-methyladenine glycosylase II
VKGIGRWTAEMFLIFCLGRLDVLPVGDLGFRNAIRRAYGLRRDPAPGKIEKIAEPWRPYRSIGTWYLWASWDKKPLSENSEQ